MFTSQRVKELKKLISLLILMLTSVLTYAQIPKQTTIQSVRRVSGIVIDSTQQTVIGALVILTSKFDTLRTSTNEDGLYFFRNVKSPDFNLTILSLGYRTYVKVGKYDPAISPLTMDPIMLNGESRLLQEIIVDGTPSITYKIDTVEYRAQNYQVREGAVVGDLLKKMEGMWVSHDGKLTYNGEEVEKARLNGRDFMAGDIPTVTKNLPAGIVEKVQIVTDYGEQAVRSGIKDGEPTKVLNITTKPEHSMGYFAKMDGGIGNDDRYNGGLIATRINANRNYTLAASINNSLNGVSENDIGVGNFSGPATSDETSFSGSGGNTQNKRASLTYRDQWGQGGYVNMNYSFTLADIRNLNSSITQNFSSIGTTILSNENEAAGNSEGHKFKFEFEKKLDSLNFLKIIPIISVNSSFNKSSSLNRLSGIIRQDQNNRYFNSGSSPEYGIDILYEHLFHKKGRVFTTLLTGLNNTRKLERQQNINVKYFDLASSQLLNDSLINSLINRNNLTRTYKGSVTYSEPLNLSSSFQFNGQIDYGMYSNRTILNDIDQGGLPGLPIVIDSLSNLFDYSVSQARIGLNYRYQFKKVGLSLGAMVVPVELKGQSSGLRASISQSSLNIIPVIRFNYAWSAQKQYSIIYSGTATQPVVEQLQPIRDVSNPQSPVIGNPHLIPGFSHSLNTGFQNYFPNSRIAISAAIDGILFQNRVIENIIQVGDVYNSLKYEKHFANTNGTYYTKGNYRISKESANRNLNFLAVGYINHQRSVGLSNNVRNISSIWTFNKRLGIGITPSENIEINPSFSYTHFRIDNTLPDALNSKTNILATRVDGRVFVKSWSITFDMSKSYVHGINSNLTNNPLILNLSLEKEFLNGTTRFRVHAFDLFNQNTVLNRMVTENSITDTRSNSLSRYFMIGLNCNFQRWKGAPTRNDKPLKRHGDGSFIH